MRIRRTLTVLVTLLLLAVAACGDDDTDVASGAGDAPPTSDATPDDDCEEGTDVCDDQSVSSPGAAGTCLEGTPDCDDTPGDLGPPDDLDDDIDVDAERTEAMALLGALEADLPADVRVARRGTETFPLTEDYRLGRDTVELDDDGSGTFVVTSVTVELPDGPETYDA